jgi:hypothetical protein
MANSIAGGLLKAGDEHQKHDFPENACSGISLSFMGLGHPQK